jgi:hypothetical protein
MIRSAGFLFDRLRGAVSAKGAAVLLSVVLAFAALTSLAAAELTSKGNLFVTFNGGILPGALPRDERAPITVWIAGKVRTLKGEHPPALRSLTIALNRNGYLETKGLPVCRYGEIVVASRKEALDLCRDALVGSGAYRARTTFPEQTRYPAFGRILAFNARSKGRPAILAHVYAEDPAASTNVIVLHIHRRNSGRYRTVLTGTSPNGLTRWGYLKRISLRLHRTYTYRGRRHSYLSAACPAPRDLKKASFNFAQASMSFVDGRNLSATLKRSCQVRRGAGS